LPLTNSLFLDSKAVWIRLNDENYPRTALWLPKIYRKRAICETHRTILSGHDALKKTYLRITNVYFWPNMKNDIQAHIDSCLRCQVRKKSTAKPTPLQPLPTVDQPNQRVHRFIWTSENFGPREQDGSSNDGCLHKVLGGNCYPGQASGNSGHGNLCALDLSVRITSLDSLRQWYGIRQQAQQKTF
jgi:hypothetical protein